MAQEPVFVVVSGGLVQDAPSFVEVIDFDNLLDGNLAHGDTEEEWGRLSKSAKAHVETQYPDEFKRIQEHMAHEKAAAIARGKAAARKARPTNGNR